RASARSTGAPNKAPSLSVSAWLAPDTKARTGWPPATNTRLLTIWATLVPMASAASWAVRVLWANSTISVSTPFSRSTARTRSLAAAADIGATSLNAGKYSSKAFLFPFAAGRGHPVAPARAKPAPRGQDRARPLWKSTPRAIRTPSTPAAIRGGEVNTTVNRFPLPKHREEDEAALRERALRRRAEERILEAMAQGAFDNLPGKGRPLDLRENPFVPPERRLAYKLLKDANFAPDWIELDREVRTAREELAAFQQRHIDWLKRQAPPADGSVPAAVLDWHRRMRAELL